MSDDIQIPGELSRLSSLISAQPESFASGSKDIRDAALTATKYIFDLALQSEPNSRPHVVELLSSLTPDAAPQTRSQSRARNGKRKRSPSPPPKKIIIEDTPLPSLFIDGMNDDQIWEQLDLRAKKLCQTLEEALEGTKEDEDENEDSILEGKELRKFLIGDEDGLEELDGIDWEAEEDFEDEDSNGDDDEEDEEDNSESESDENDAELGLDLTEELRDPSSDEHSEADDPHLDLDLPGKRNTRHKKRKSGHSVLDDDFFDLASFNAEADEAEARSVSKGRLGDDDDELSDDDMSVDLFAPVDDVDNLEDETLDDPDTDAEPLYRDFFDPPSRAPVMKPKIKEKKQTQLSAPPTKTGKVRFHEEVRVRSIKPKGKNLPLASMYAENDEDDDHEVYDEEMTFDDLEGEEGFESLGDGDEDDEMGSFHFRNGDHLDEDSSEDDDEAENGLEEGDGRDTIARLKDDLFAEEDEPQNDLSTHEKRMASLREQIQELESENVAKKDWVLMGEATSRARPHNSLLEEDLEFERVMKAVPVITEELVQGLEERIKTRILEGSFDDVVRLRPMDDKPFLPSRFLELQDTKSSQSLAQIYEDEYTAAKTGGLAGEDRDGKLKKEHDDIEKLWEGVCAKLDALCNAHFMPKQPKATITSVSNVPAATLESALPTSKTVSSMLAPEEIFAPSSSDPRARSELTPTEKRALRTKERKARKKSRDALDKGVVKFAKTKSIGGVKKQKEAALKSVVKTGRGVTVVGKKSKDILAKKSRTRQ